MSDQAHQTSSQLLRVTSDRAVWAQLYRTSSFLRPPGPFAYHSAKDLEDTLARSEKLAATWASKGQLQPVSGNVLLTEGLDDPASLSLLLGRWLIVGGRFGMNCYDLDATTQWDRPVAHLPRSVRSIEGRVSTSSTGVHACFVAVISTDAYLCVHLCSNSLLSTRH